LRKAHPCDEAFLVVFRRSGPLVDLPKVVRHEGLKLYSVVVDISEEGGSKEKGQVISLSEAELRPTPAHALSRPRPGQQGEFAGQRHQRTPALR
jgi:hypothetical protein